MTGRATGPLRLSGESGTVARWDAFVERYVGRRSGVAGALREVIDTDPGLAVPHAAGLLMALLDVAEFDLDEEATAARRGRAEHDWERSFVEVTLTTHSQGIWQARAGWLRHHRRFPADLIGLNLAVYLTLTSTEPDAQDQALAQARASADVVGEHPLLIGFEAMIAQDQGRLDDAHRLATRALELDPTGFDGGHPLAHVHFESGDHEGGLVWLDAWLPTTDREASFGSHLVWHAALHHLAVGDADAAVERYRHCAGRPGAGAVVDGTSLLWRCQLHGLVPAGTDPSDTPVAPMVAPLVTGVPTTFVGVHVALGLATDLDAEGLRRFAAAARGFSAPGAAELLPGLAVGLAAYVEGDYAAASNQLLLEEPHVARYGGSHAQREVFEDTLLHALTRAGRLEEATRRLLARLDRRESPLDANLLARVRHAG